MVRVVIAGSVRENNIGMILTNSSHQTLSLRQPGSQKTVIKIQHFVFNACQFGNLFSFLLSAHRNGATHLLVMSGTTVGCSEKPDFMSTVQQFQSDARRMFTIIRMSANYHAFCHFSTPFND